MVNQVRLSGVKGDAGDIAGTLFHLAQLIDPDFESVQPLTDEQFYALSGRPIGKDEMDRRWLAGHLRDHVATILGQLGDRPPLL